MRVASRLAAAAAVARGPFRRISDKDLAVLERVVGASHVMSSDIHKYSVDWTGQMKGNPSCVVEPRSTEEVSAILSHCSSQKLAVVVQGGNTGLVGGATPVHDELVLSLRRFTNHFHLDQVSGVMSADTGFILQTLDERVASSGWMMPLDLGAKGSCQLGGCIAAGAGGIRLIRYGSLHAHLLGATVVDGTGRVLEFGSSLRKDNTALHAAHLLIGSEGQLGVVTRANLTLVPRPASQLTAMLGLRSFSECRRLLQLARRRLAEILSSFELMDAETLRAVKENLGLPPLLSSRPPFTILVETHGSVEEHDMQKLEAFLEEAISSGIADDGVLAKTGQERAQMWRLREESPIAVMKDGFIYKFDISLPLAHFYELTEIAREKLAGLAKVYCYGHVGDGNAHLNITTTTEDKELSQSLPTWVLEWVVAHGGSISAEHGIGQLKRDFSHLGKSREERETLAALKAVFDPHSILCPYKMFGYSV